MLFFVLCLLFLSAALLSGGLSGWWRLTAMYGEKPPATAISRGSFRWVTGTLRRFPLTLAIEIYPEGYWMQPAFPLSLLMPGLFIPWTELSLIREKDSVFSQHAAFRINGFAGDLVLKGSSSAAVREMWPAKQEAGK